MAHEVLFKDDSDSIREYLNETKEHIDIFVDSVTPLMNAVIKNRNDVIDILLEYGSNVNLRSGEGWTALHFACSSQKNNRTMVQKLLDAKANANITNYYGYTPLQLAAIHTTDVNIIHLLTLYSNSEHKNIYGGTALFTAIIHNRNIEIISALCYWSVMSNDINLTDYNGNTALTKACDANNYKAIKLLLEKGADINITNNYNETPYKVADAKGKKIINEYFNSKKKSI